MKATRFGGEWETRPLRDLADCLDHMRVPLNEAQRRQMPGPYPYCGANGIVDHIADYVLDDDVILIAEDGGHFEEHAHRPIAYRMTGKIWVNNHAHVLRAKPGFSQAFLFFALVHKDILPFLASGTRSKLNRGEMNKIALCLPRSATEQRAIAAVLSDVDELIGSLEALIAKKRAIKQAAMQELLTGRTRLPGFGGEWDTHKFGDVLEQIPSTRFQVPTSEYRTAGRFPVIDQGKDPVVAWSNRADRVFTPPIDGVIIFGDHTRVVKYWNDPLILGADGTKLLGSHGESVPEFLFHALRATELPNTGYNRHLKFLLEARFTRPQPREQQAIATVLSDMDAEIAALEHRLDKTRAIKQGMMQQLLTGSIRLPIPDDDTEDDDAHDA